MTDHIHGNHDDCDPRYCLTPSARPASRDAEIAALLAERDEWKSAFDASRREIAAIRSNYEARCAELEVALRPFADAWVAFERASVADKIHPRAMTHEMAGFSVWRYAARRIYPPAPSQPVKCVTCDGPHDVADHPDVFDPPAPCATCGGTGRVWKDIGADIEAAKSCATCGGMGALSRPFFVGSRGEIVEPCHECKKGGAK